jgi:hypothetical protein
MAISSLPPHKYPVRESWTFKRHDKAETTKRQTLGVFICKSATIKRIKNAGKTNGAPSINNQQWLLQVQLPGHLYGAVQDENLWVKACMLRFWPSLSASC